MKQGYIANIEKETLENTNFRKVLYTGEKMQLVVMAIKPGEDIGIETHPTHDQFIRIESGQGLTYINGTETAVHTNDAIIIPAGAEHNITNTGSDVLKLYTLYAPPEHKDGVVLTTKQAVGGGHFDGTTTESN